MKIGILALAFGLAASAALAQENGHWYSVEDQGTYGYQRSPAPQGQRQPGVPPPLAMAHFLGRKGGNVVMEIVDGERRVVMTCSVPCERIKGDNFLAGTYMGSTVVPYAEGTLMWAMLEDAIHGRLKVYKGPAGNPGKAR